MSDDFLNMPKTFEPFQDSSGFSEDVLKTSEKVPKHWWCLFILQRMQINWFGKIIARIGGFIPLKKPEREAWVNDPHFHCLDVSFVIKSVGTNRFSYFLLFLFCARKLMNFKTFGGWEKLACLADNRRGEKLKWARDDPASFEPLRASRAQSSRTSRARRSLFPPLQLGKSENRPAPKRKQL